MGNLFRGIRDAFKHKSTKKQERLESPAEGQKPDTDLHFKYRGKKRKIKKQVHKHKQAKRGMGKHSVDKRYRAFPARQQLKRRQGVHGL